MKLKFLLLVVPVVALSLFIQSCGDDEEPVKNVLITSHRGTGQFYSLDLTTGVTTPILLFHNQVPLLRTSELCISPQAE